MVTAQKLSPTEESLEQYKIIALKNQRRLESIAETVNDGILIVNREGVITYANNAAEKIFGLKRENIINRPFDDPAWKVTTVEGSPFVVEDHPFIQVMKAGRGVQGIELSIARSDGSRVILSINAVPFVEVEGDPTGMIGTLTDITRKKQLENELFSSERRFKDIIDLSPLGAHLYELKEDGRLIFTGANRACSRILGIDCGKFIGKTIEEAFPQIAVSEVPNAFRRAALYGESYNTDQLLYNEQGISGIYDIRAFQTGYRRMAVFFQDVTENRKALEALRQSEERYRAMVEATSDWIWEIDADNTYVYVSPKVKDILGYEINEVIGKMPFDLMPPEEAKRVRAGFEMARGERKPFFGLENINQHKDGRLIVLETSGVPVFDEKGRLAGYRGIDRDITKRKKAESALQDSRLFVERIIDTTPNIVYIYDVVEGRHIYMNRQSERILGYSMEAIREMGGNFFKNLLHPDDLEKRGTEIQQLASSPKGTVTTVECRLKSADGQWRWFQSRETVFSRDSDGTLRQILGTATDISGRKRIEDELKTSYNKLTRTTEGIIDAISKIVETRDPYTAGHQRRVSQLAFAMAKELGLDEKQAQTIRVAGIIHDIGKIYIPAEILSKPGKLDTAEYAMVKGHPFAGFNILSPIELPWPAAEIAHQHHERLDGSGYPQGLKSFQIVFEAKIVSVADTVEAMVFHRPYRTAVGLDMALNEIMEHKGKSYDTEAVDVCVRLFKEKGFQFQM